MSGKEFLVSKGVMKADFKTAKESAEEKYKAEKASLKKADLEKLLDTLTA